MTFDLQGATLAFVIKNGRRFLEDASEKIRGKYDGGCMKGM